MYRACIAYSKKRCFRTGGCQSRTGHVLFSEGSPPDHFRKHLKWCSVFLVNFLILGRRKREVPKNDRTPPSANEGSTLFFFCLRYVFSRTVAFGLLPVSRIAARLTDSCKKLQDVSVACALSLNMLLLPPSVRFQHARGLLTTMRLEDSIVWLLLFKKRTSTGSGGACHPWPPEKRWSGGRTGRARRAQRG